MLGVVLHHRVLVLMSFVGALVLTFGFVGPRLGIQLFPQDDSKALYIKFDAPLGTPLEQTESVVTAVERQLPAILGSDLAAVTARVGHQQGDNEGVNRERGAAENEAVINVQFVDTDRAQTSAEWIEILERELIVPPDVRITYAAEIMGPPVGQPVTVHVAANGDELRRGTSLEIADWLRRVGGVTNIDVDERPGTPQIELNLDYRKLALRGLDAESVGMTLRAAFQGIVASEHRDLDETTEYRVLFDPAARQSLDALLETPVRARDGALVRLRDVVHPIEVPAVQRIYHRDGVRTATVRAQFAAGSPHTALSMAERVERELFPRYAGIDGLEVYYGGEAIETRKTTADVGIAALLAFAGIAIVIALMLGSFLEAAFVVAIIPFSLAGVMLTFFIHGQPLSIFAMMGTVGLAGVVVNASIVMVDAIHRSVGPLSNPSPRERLDAIIDAVVSRLRPILVTTLTTLGGVLPTAYGLGGHDAVVAPMSLALGWGLALSTLVTLILVPTLYTIANDLRTAPLGSLRENLTLRLVPLRERDSRV
jgi:multidrug efflux pump subunit AcrB